MGLSGIRPDNIVPVEAFFIDANDPVVGDIYNGVYSSLPFSKGDTITLQVINNDPKFWKPKEYKKKYRIERIDFELKTRYPSTNTVSSVKRKLEAYIYVIEL